MGKKDKLLKRFMSLPKDFTFLEISTLLAQFGYCLHNKGATSGSRVRFKNEKTGDYIDIHKPHPGKVMKSWMLKEVKNHLKQNGLI